MATLGAPWSILRLGRSLLAVLALAAGISLIMTPAQAATSCDLYASTTGGDSAPGTVDAPFRTARRLVSSLHDGQTGCLLGGTFNESVRISTGGSFGSPITLTSAPGTRATLVGRLWIADSANDVVVSNLNLDGRNWSNLPSPTVNGDRVRFRGNDVTNYNTSICFVLGSQAYGIAVGPVIEGNRIHDCGKLPPTNHEHGIYVEATRNAVIRGNVITDNADRGIQLYPDAQGSLIEYNTIVGNGTGIIISGDTAEDANTGGSGYLASSNNLIRFNAIANSVRYNVESSWWGGPPGAGNVVQDNCLWNGGRGNIGDSGGFTAAHNVVADPSSPACGGRGASAGSQSTGSESYRAPTARGRGSPSRSRG